MNYEIKLVFFVNFWKMASQRFINVFSISKLTIRLQTVLSVSRWNFALQIHFRKMPIFYLTGCSIGNTSTSSIQ